MLLTKAWEENSMNKAKKTIIGSSAALFGAGYLLGRRHQDNNKSTYQKLIDKLDSALD